MSLEHYLKVCFHVYKQSPITVSPCRPPKHASFNVNVTLSAIAYVSAGASSRHTHHLHLAVSDRPQGTEENGEDSHNHQAGVSHSHPLRSGRCFTGAIYRRICQKVLHLGDNIFHYVGHVVCVLDSRSRRTERPPSAARVAASQTCKFPACRRVQIV